MLRVGRKTSESQCRPGPWPPLQRPEPPELHSLVAVDLEPYSGRLSKKTDVAERAVLRTKDVRQDIQVAKLRDMSWP